MDTIDTPGSYLHKESDEEVIIIPKGKLADILVNIDPKLYRKCVVLEKGVKELYVNIQKSIYGLLHSSLLFYIKSATYLKNNGFIINAYDLCVKKMVKGVINDSGMEC